MQNNDQMVVQMTVVQLQELVSNAVALGIKEHQDSISTIEKSESDEILTREQVAKILKVSYPTLWKWNNEGTLKNHKRGSRVYYMKVDVMFKVNENTLSKTCK